MDIIPKLFTSVKKKISICCGDQIQIIHFLRKRLGNTQERGYFFEKLINLKLSRRMPVFFDPSVIKMIKSQLKIPSNAGMRYNRNVEIAKKVFLFLLAFKHRNISLAYQKLGYRRSYFYFWFNRLKQANFDIKSLEQRSRRPVSHTQKTLLNEEEFYRLNSYKSLKEIQVAFNQWIFNYNYKRPHGGINKMTPTKKLELKLNPP